MCQVKSSSVKPRAAMDGTVVTKSLGWRAIKQAEGAPLVLAVHLLQVGLTQN